MQLLMQLLMQEYYSRRSLLSEIGFPQRDATNVFEDNKGARDLCKNPIFQKRTRHIEIKYHFVRNHIEDGTIRIVSVRSEDQFADFLTKACRVKSNAGDSVAILARYTCHR